MTYLIDLAILITLALFGFDGYRRGFIQILAEFFTTIASLALAFWLAKPAAEPIGSLTDHLFKTPAISHQLIAFFLIWIIAQSILQFTIGYLYQFLPDHDREALPNKIGGIIPSIAKGVIGLSLVLTVLATLPIDNQLRPLIAGSYLGGSMVATTQKIEQQLASRFQDQLSSLQTALISTPFHSQTQTEGESLKLGFTTTKVSPDPASEQKLFDLVNKERAKVGLGALTFRPELLPVARAHATDMFAKGYFAHVNPDGKDPFNRIEAAGIHYQTAGENLAYAPTVEIAHTGLMNSPKHRENILFSGFGQMAIGVIDAGVYGKMFVQLFSD